MSVLEELRSREPLFHRPELGTSGADAEAMISHDYWEVGASGARYDREAVLAVLAERAADPDYVDPWPAGRWSAEEFACRALGAEVYLLTYVLRQGERVTRRATLWQRDGGRWVALYHQGTLVSPAS